MENLTIDYVNNELVAENPPPEEKCPICYEPFDMEQIFSLPECGHTFHTNCIYHWARLGNNNCPYCNNTGQTNDTNSENSNQYEGFYYYNSEILTEKLSIIRKAIFLFQKFHKLNIFVFGVLLILFSQVSMKLIGKNIKE